MLTRQWLNHSNFISTCKNANYISIAFCCSIDFYSSVCLFEDSSPKWQLHGMLTTKKAIHIIKLILLLNFNIKVNLFSHTFDCYWTEIFFIIIIWAFFSFFLLQLFILIVLISLYLSITLFIFVCVRSRFLVVFGCWFIRQFELNLMGIDVWLL